MAKAIYYLKANFRNGITDLYGGDLARGFAGGYLGGGRVPTKP